MELEPNNANLQTSLKAAQSKLDLSPIASTIDTQSRDAGAAPGGGMDFASLLNNPALMNMAKNMMSNGGLESLMKNPSIAKM